MPKSLNRSLENALDLLELLSNGRSLRSGEIAEKLGLKPNTANNMVRTLFRRGYVSQDTDSRYLLGPKSFFLGQGQHSFKALRSVALPFLLQLSAETGDNAFLGIECDGRLYMVAHAEGTNVIRANEPQKWQSLLHCTAAGKVILAEKGIDWFHRMNGDRELVKLSEKTLVTIESLATEVSRIREMGYAECIDETVEGVHAIGVAVRCADGTFVGGLSQSFPSFLVREGSVNVSERLSLLREYSEKLSAAFTPV